MESGLPLFPPKHFGAKSRFFCPVHLVLLFVPCGAVRRRRVCARCGVRQRTQHSSAVRTRPTARRFALESPHQLPPFIGAFLKNEGKRARRNARKSGETSVVARAQRYAVALIGFSVEFCIDTSLFYIRNMDLLDRLRADEALSLGSPPATPSTAGAVELDGGSVGGGGGSALAAKAWEDKENAAHPTSPRKPRGVAARPPGRNAYLDVLFRTGPLRRTRTRRRRRRRRRRRQR